MSLHQCERAFTRAQDIVDVVSLTQVSKSFVLAAVERMIEATPLAAWYCDPRVKTRLPVPSWVIQKLRVCPANKLVGLARVKLCAGVSVKSLEREASTLTVAPGVSATGVT